MVRPRVYGAGAYFDPGGMGNDVCILPATVARPLEEGASGGTECGENRTLRVNHKGHEGTQRIGEIEKPIGSLSNHLFYALIFGIAKMISTLQGIPLWSFVSFVVKEVYGIDS
jgi:hypothetical protein